jgi:hypothetical protein
MESGEKTHPNRGRRASESPFGSSQNETTQKVMANQNMAVSQHHEAEAT